MANNKQRSAALLIFYVLVIYVVAQFFSWAFFMIKQSQEIYDTKLALLPINANSDAQEVLQKELTGKHFMVAGEGCVFLIILVLGVIIIRKSFKKESQLVAKQKTFLNSVTHEFKSPVASMRLQLETLQKRSLTLEQQQQALANAIDDTDRLDRLIEKILMAARIDSGALLIHAEFMNLSEKIKEVIEQVKRSYPQRSVVTNIQDNVFLKIDPWALDSIITNLMENAFLYSPADKPVEVNLASNDHVLKLSVKDQGIGIANDEKNKVLRKFYRSDATQGYKGTGLGLFLTDYFVKAHRGKIEIKDNKPEGTLFEIHFPLIKTDVHK